MFFNHNFFITNNCHHKLVSLYNFFITQLFYSNFSIQILFCHKRYFSEVKLFLKLFFINTLFFIKKNWITKLFSSQDFFHHKISFITIFFCAVLYAHHGHSLNLHPGSLGQSGRLHWNVVFATNQTNEKLVGSPYLQRYCMAVNRRRWTTIK